MYSGSGLLSVHQHTPFQWCFVGGPIVQWCFAGGPIVQWCFAGGPIVQWCFAGGPIVQWCFAGGPIVQWCFAGGQIVQWCFAGGPIVQWCFAGGPIVQWCFAGGPIVQWCFAGGPIVARDFILTGYVDSKHEFTRHYTWFKHLLLRMSNITHKRSHEFTRHSFNHLLLRSLPNGRILRFVFVKKYHFFRFFMVMQPDTLMRNHKKSERVAFLDENNPQE